MAFEDADLSSAIAKLASGFSDAELEALSDFVAGGGDGDGAEVAGFRWDPAADQASLLQRVEAHPGFKPLRIASLPTPKGVVACPSPSGD